MKIISIIIGKLVIIAGNILKRGSVFNENSYIRG